MTKELSNGPLLTTKDFKLNKYKLSFAVVTPEGVIMQKGFSRMDEAKKFRDTAYRGYYSHCEVRLVKTI